MKTGPAPAACSCNIVPNRNFNCELVFSRLYYILLSSRVSIKEHIILPAKSRLKTFNYYIII